MPPDIDGSPLLEDIQTLSVLLQQFCRRLEDPLLSLPDPKLVCLRLFHAPPSSARHNRRLAAKGKGISLSAVKRAHRILMSKLGICRDNEKLSATHRILKSTPPFLLRPWGLSKSVHRLELPVDRRGSLGGCAVRLSALAWWLLVGRLHGKKICA
jgi:hypothetical protein